MRKGEKIDFSKVTPEITDLTNLCLKNSSIEQEWYIKYNVNRGLRDLNGKGVLTGLTEISEIKSYNEIDGVLKPCEGQLFYRGIDVQKIVAGVFSEKRFGFEETIYLLLFGQLPTQNELLDFNKILSDYRRLPNGFVRNVIMNEPSKDMMNILARSVITLYSYDSNADNTNLDNVLRQCLQLISSFHLLSVYGYQVYCHHHKYKSLVMHRPNPELSMAENILYLLRKNSKYTELEARILDIALILHAEHGGGNNSTFTTRVVSSSGTDTYSAIAAAIGSLKGPKHGGANIKVVQMFKDMKENVKDWKDDDEISAYLEGLLKKENFDKSGLIYGMGHAVYSLSDPRANVFKGFVKSLSEEKGLTDEYELYTRVERLAPVVISKVKKIYKGVSTNIDFYSGFVYDMLGLPTELFTPIFAIARISGWSAHRMEELINANKIIRPAYMDVQPRQDYIDISKR